MWFVSFKDDLGNTLFYGQSRGIQNVKNWSDAILHDEMPFDGCELSVYYESDKETMREGVIDNTGLGLGLI